MIYLVGTIHPVQHGIGNENMPLIVKLDRILSNLCETIKPSLIAEEASSDSLIEYGVHKTRAQEAAETNGIEYRFCDMGLDERKAHGLKFRGEIIQELGFNENSLTPGQEKKVNEAARPYDEKRERFWLEKIKDRINLPVVFVCGKDHCESFFQLLVSKGCGVKIIKVL